LIGLFKRRVGVTPKAFARLMRFWNALSRLEQGRYDSLAAVAMDCGYYDQSHFINDFQDFAGINPRTYLRGPSAKTSSLRTRRKFLQGCLCSVDYARSAFRVEVNGVDA